MTETKLRNKLDRFNIHRLGLGDADGELELLVDPVNSGNSSFLADHPNRIDGVRHVAQRVKIVKFDDWAKNAGLVAPQTPSWVAKVDVEGFELKVLHGMRTHLEAGCFKAVTVEVFARTLALAGATPADIFAYMDSLGFAAIDEEAHSLATPATDDQNRNVLFLYRGVSIPGYGTK